MSPRAMSELGPLRVFAAGSLRPAFERLAAVAPGTLDLEYANARDLAQRIAAGERTDVFASASPAHPRGLHEAGLVGPPLSFAANRLVVAVPAASPAQDVAVLAEPGVRVVVEVEGIPLGDYTRAMLSRLDEIVGEGFAARTFANVVDEMQTVDVVAERLLTGDADAAVLYATDVAARPGRLRAIEVPRAAAVDSRAWPVSSGDSTARGGRCLVQALTYPPARGVLQRGGFVPL